MTPIRETIARAVYDATAGDLPSRDLDEVADAVLRALDEAGLVVVPKEASEGMLAAAGDAFLDAVVGHVPGNMPGANTPFRRFYRAMIAAAPPAEDKP